MTQSAQIGRHQHDHDHVDDDDDDDDDDDGRTDGPPKAEQKISIFEAVLSNSVSLMAVTCYTRQLLPG